MGASKEGTMSVREAINQVLRQANIEDDRDHDHNHEPPDRDLSPNQSQPDCDLVNNSLVPSVTSSVTATTTPIRQGQGSPFISNCNSSSSNANSCPSSTSTTAATTTTSLSFITPIVSTIKGDVAATSTSNSISVPLQCGVVGATGAGVVLRDHPYSGPGPVVVKIDTSDSDGSNAEEGEGTSQNEIQSQGETSEAGGGGDVNVRPGRRKYEGGVVEEIEKEEESKTITVDILEWMLKGDLVRDQLALVKCISERLSISELKRETAEKEKKQLQTTLELEKQERLTLLDKFVSSEEQRLQFEARINGQAATIKGQHETIKSHQATIIANQQVISKQKETIQELEAKILALQAPKDVTSRETCMTPPPPPSPPSSVLSIPTGQSEIMPPDSNSSCMPATVVSSNTPGEEGADGEEDAPLRKRMKMIMTSAGLKRSDCPPRLSPAVTPKTSAFNSISCMPLPSSSKAMRAFFGAEADEDLGPDEFHDELELINNLTRTDTSSGGEIFRSKLLQKDGGMKDRQHHESPSSNFSAFTRPYPKSSRPKPRFMAPESRQQRLIPSFFKNRHLLLSNPPAWPSSPGSGSMNVPKNSSSSSFNRISSLNSSSTTAMSMSSKEPPQFSSLRNNNFLNLSRPVARRPQVGVTPPPSSGDYRSLDLTPTLSSSPFSSEVISTHATPDATSTPTSSSPKKRPPGRPPGSLSRYKTRLPASPSIATSTNTPTTPASSASSVSSSFLQNGTPEEPRFSQRGRLLKPNRQRFSPTLDATVNQKEKLMTTKKNYIVTEPFATDQLGEDINTTGDGTTAKGMEDTGSTGQSEKEKNEGDDEKSKEGTDNGEPEEVVEVPKWRISIVEGFKEGEIHRAVVDDMSDEAYLKRHQKLETKEKQRKRWDSQRLREETYLDRLKRKQEERERQKELRRQQRKRKGKSDATEEEESVLPSVEDIKAIHVSEELPVGAFGHSLPIVEKVAFQLMWIPLPEVIMLSHSPSSVTSPTPPTLDNDKDDVSVDKVQSENSDESGSDSEIEMLDIASLSPSSSLRSRSPSPLISFSEIENEGQGETPPPPKIYPMNYLSEDDENSLSGSEDDDDDEIGRSSSDAADDDEDDEEEEGDVDGDDEETDVEMHSADELSDSDSDYNDDSALPLDHEHEPEPIPSNSPPPSATTITIDLFYPEGECSSSSSPEHQDQSQELIELDEEIPLETQIPDDEQVCSSSISSSPPPSLHAIATSLPSVVVSRLEKVNLIKCPLGSPTSTSCTPSSSTESSSSSRGSITFFIPNNPLSSSLKKSSGDVSSSTNTAIPSSSSSPTSSTESTEQFCEDRNIRS